jgi:hypothetical protein
LWRFLQSGSFRGGAEMPKCRNAGMTSRLTQHQFRFDSTWP